MHKFKANDCFWICPYCFVMCLCAVEPAVRVLNVLFVSYLVVFCLIAKLLPPVSCSTDSVKDSIICVGEINDKRKSDDSLVIRSRPFHGFRRHLGWGSVAAKITANVWEIVQLSNLVTPLLYNGV